MANNCLVTKLKGTVNNDELPVFGMVKVRAKATGEDATFFTGASWAKEFGIKSSTLFSVYKASGSDKGALLAENVYEYTAINNDLTYPLIQITVPNDNQEHVYYIKKDTVQYIGQSNIASVDLHCEIQFDLDELLYTPDLIYTRGILHGNLETSEWPSLQNMTGFYADYGSTVAGDVTPLIQGNMERLTVYSVEAELDFDTLPGTVGRKMKQLSFYGQPKFKGDVLDWCTRMYDNGNGKTSGSIQFAGIGSNATIGDYGWGGGVRTVTFSPSGITVA